MKYDSLRQAVLVSKVVQEICKAFGEFDAILRAVHGAGPRDRTPSGLGAPMTFPCPVCMSDDIETPLHAVRELAFETRRQRVRGYYYGLEGYTKTVEATVTHCGHCPKHGAVDITTRVEYHDGT